jgi:hypothetical protein
VGLAECGTHALTAAAMGPYRTGEWKASPFPDCGNCVFLSRYLRFQELVADLLRRPVPVR